MPDEAVTPTPRGTSGRRKVALAIVAVLLVAAVIAAIAAVALTVREVKKEPPLAGEWRASTTQDGRDVGLRMSIAEDGAYTVTQESSNVGGIEAARGEWYQTPEGGRGARSGFVFKGDDVLVMSGSANAGEWRRVGPRLMDGDAVEERLVGVWERPVTRDGVDYTVRLAVDGDGSYVETLRLVREGVLTLDDGAWTSTIDSASGTYDFTSDDTIAITDSSGTITWTRNGNPWDDAESVTDAVTDAVTNRRQ